MNIFKAPEHSRKTKKVFPESTLKYPPQKVQEILTAISGKLRTESGAYSPDYNKNGELTQALAMLDCFDDGQKRLYMENCRRLSEYADEVRFIDILSRGSCYGYTYEYCGRPDFSVMRDISPEDFPHFLAVAMKSKNGYCRQEALRYAGNYPLLLPHITAALGDRVKQVRQEAAEAFGKAMENIPRTEEVVGRGRENYAAFEAMLSAKLAMERVLQGGHYDRGVVMSAEERLNGCISRELDRDMVYCCKSCYARRRMGGVMWHDRKSKAYVLLIKQELMSPEAVRAVIECDKWCSPGVSCAASVYLDLPEDMLESLADCPYSIAARNAVTRLFERRGIWKGSEKYLMSSFASVRETAVYYWRQETGGKRQECGIPASEQGDITDLYEYYRQRLPEKAAVWGTGYCATPEKRDEAARLLTGLIDTENTKTAEAAVYSLAGLYSERDCPEDIREMFCKRISDPRGRVSKAAFRAFRRGGFIMRNDVIYNDVMGALGSGRKNAHLTAKRLAMALTGQPGSSSGKFPWVLRLCVCPCEDVRLTAQRWVLDRLRGGRIFSGMDKGERQEVLTAADEVFSGECAALMPEGLEEFIRFSLTGKVDHAGCDMRELMYGWRNI